MQIKQIIKVMCCIFCILIVCSCNSNENKKLIVGVSPDYPPFAFEYRNSLIGFDIDLISAISERLNYNVEFKKMNFDELLPALENKTVDLVASSVTQTPERSEKFDFSHPYYTPTFAIVFKKDKIKEIHIINDINGIIGVEKNTTMSDYLEKILDNIIIDNSTQINNFQNNHDNTTSLTNIFLRKKNLLEQAVLKRNIAEKSIVKQSDDKNNEKIPEQEVKKDFQIKLYTGHLDLLSGLENDEINAMFVEILQAEVITQNNRDLSYIPMKFDNNENYYYGIVFPQNSKLTSKFNKALEDIDSEGKIDILRLRWFSGYGIYGDILKNN